MGKANGKIALVTGATKGIGYATARALAQEGAHVLVHARRRFGGEMVVRKLQQEVPGGRFYLVVADVSSIAGTRQLAREVLATAPHLDILINNVGAMYSDLTLTEDGIETTFAVNHLSVFLLTNLLLSRMKFSAPARIITIASEVHRKAEMNFKDINFTGDYSAVGALAQSKLANILFTRALAKRLQKTGVEAYCLHPGHVKTAFTRDLRGWMKVFVSILRLSFLSPAQGAETGVFLATAPSLGTANGQYYVEGIPADPSDHACDDAVAEQLWALSEEMTKIGAFEASPSTGTLG